jgi:hypothetical protein
MNLYQCQRAKNKPLQFSSLKAGAAKKLAARINDPGSDAAYITLLPR